MYKKMNTLYKLLITTGSTLVIGLIINSASATSNLAYTTKTTSFTIKDDDSPIGHWETSIQYPELSGNSASINAINASIAQVATEFKCDNKGEKHFQAEITLLNKKFVSLKYSDSWYCAGMPHTQGRTGAMTYSLIDGKQIDFEHEMAQWNGVYKYDAMLGENVAEDKIIIEYELVLKDGDCKLSVQGYQTDETLLCTVEEHGVDLNIKFNSYADGSTENIYGVAIYPPNSTLFQLTSTPDSLITTWGSLLPDDSHSSGKYFIKK